MANYFCETYLVISNLLYGTSTLSSPRVPPMIGFAFLQLACVYLLHTAVTSSTSLLWMHSLACSRHSCSTQSMIATQKGNSWRLNQGGVYGCLRLLRTFMGVLREKIHKHASLRLLYQGVYLFVLSNTSVKLI